LARLEVIADAYLSVGTPVQLATPSCWRRALNFRLKWSPRVQENLRELDAQISRQAACNRLLCQGGWPPFACTGGTVRRRFGDHIAVEGGMYVHPGISTTSLSPVI